MKTSQNISLARRGGAQQGGFGSNDVLASSSTLVYGSPITRLSHAGHASFTRAPRGRRKTTVEARVVVTVW